MKMTKTLLLALFAPLVLVAALPTNDQLLALMAERYARDMSNETGRVAWHGKAVQTVVSTNAEGRLIKTLTYTDGYTHTELGRPAQPLKPKVRGSLPQRLAAAAERRATEMATTNTITIITNANQPKGK